MGNGKILVVVDESNFAYYTLFGAFSKWKKFSRNAFNIKPADETDQDNLPNLLVYDDFKKILHEQIQTRLGTIDWIVRENHQVDVDMCDGVDYVFSQDDTLTNNFRKQMYPEYKAQRKLVKRQYDVSKIKNYIIDVAMKELDLETKYGYRYIRVRGCESDDVIASIMKRFTDYDCRIIISSDHDFLQLDNVHQYDMAGNKIKREVAGEQVDAEEFVIWKSICGDVSDNIAGVFRGVGEKKSLALVKDRKRLKSMLMESQDSANQFKMNMSIIDFRRIPKELEDGVVEEFNKQFSTKVYDKDFMNLLDDISEI